jgi:iron complex outermembrane receptor protein
MKKNILLVSTMLSALALSNGLAHAATPTDSTTNNATTIGEVVVTAEKRQANLQTVPEAVTAFTSRDRNLKGIQTVQDMTNFTPGLTYSSQLDRPAIRGLSRDTNIYLADSSVAVYYDDFFSNSTFLVGRDDMLIDQVEVLLGPQGTLYGRNAIGGLINTVSKKPTEDLTGEVRVTTGNYGYNKVEGTVSGPIFPGFSFRLSGYLDNQDHGYLNNVVPGYASEGGVRHDPYGDFQLQYKGDKDDLWFDSYVVGFNGDRGGPGSLLGNPTEGDYGTAPTVYGQSFFNPNYAYSGAVTNIMGQVPGAIGLNNPVVTTGNLRDFAHSVATDITVDKAYTFTFHWTHHFDGFDVKYVGGYSQYHYELHDNWFGNDNSPITQYTIPIGPTCASFGVFLGGTCDTPLTVYPSQTFSFTTQTDWYSHELTFSSTWNKPVQWIAGLYYYQETDNNPETITDVNQPQLLHPLPQGTNPAVANPGHLIDLLDYQDRIQSAAAYGQVDWKITPTIKLTGGLRYTFDWKHGTEEARFLYFGQDVLGSSPYNQLPASAIIPGLPSTIGANDLFTPQNLGAGLPSFEITQSYLGTGPGPGICGLPVFQTSGPFAGAYTRCLSDHSQALTGTAGIEWTPDDKTLVYARYNRGYKAFALNAGFVGPNPEAAPEHVNDYEVGIKKTFGNTLVVNLDGFYYDYMNDQVPLGTAGASGVTFTEFYNVPKAVADGIELTTDWRPIPHLDLSLTYGLDHTSVTSNCTAVNGVAVGACYEDALDPYATAPGARPVGNLTSGVFYLQSVKGDELPNAPENKVAFNANYTWVFGPGNLSLSGTYVWKDSSYASIFTRVYDEAPSWSQVNLRAMWSGDHDRYEIILYCNNLFNTYGYDAAATGYIVGTGTPLDAFGAPLEPTPGGANIPTYAQQHATPSFDLTPPRLYGIELHYKF